MLPLLPPAVRYILSPILTPIYALATLSTRSFISSPQFLQVRALHRLFASLSIAITQLAGVWTTNTPSAEEALVVATNMAKMVEVDGMCLWYITQGHADADR